ncbi:hypothetical protein [Raoultella sp. T31]|uniref:hypothetical protein n=1 Tax=Raoultella sp. T31 TaxID=2054594 RepID=UPI001055879A
MSRKPQCQQQIYEYLKERGNNLYSLKQLATILNIPPEDVKSNLSSLSFDDVVQYEMTSADTFYISNIAESFGERAVDEIDKYWQKQTKKLIKIYKEQGYSPEQCSEISDIDLQTVNKYWSK